MELRLTLEQEISLTQNAKAYWESRKRRGIFKVFFWFHNIDVDRKIEHCERNLTVLLQAKEGKNIYDRHFKSEQIAGSGVVAISCD